MRVVNSMPPQVATFLPVVAANHVATRKGATTLTTTLTLTLNLTPTMDSATTLKVLFRFQTIEARCSSARMDSAVNQPWILPLINLGDATIDPGFYREWHAPLDVFSDCCRQERMFAGYTYTKCSQRFTMTHFTSLQASISMAAGWANHELCHCTGCCHDSLHMMLKTPVEEPPHLTMNSVAALLTSCNTEDTS
jgi:hypothetical protein